MKNIECEVRAIIDEEKYIELLKQFKNTFTYKGSDEQETYYFDSKEDLRIQKNEQYAKVWLKKGMLHDEQREEIEIKVGKNEFEKLEQLFLALGYQVDVKWFRTRHSFEWDEIDVALDFTRGYGYIIELEKLSNIEDKETTVELLKEKLKSLNIDLTAKEVFNKKYSYYKENWKKLVV